MISNAYKIIIEKYWKQVIMILFTICAVVLVGYLATTKTGGSQSGTDYVSKCHKLIPYNTLSISPVTRDHAADHTHRLRDYYIKCAFNACASGKFEGGAVELCALDNCLKNGSRGLDFEIYSVDGEPVISCSNTRKGTTKGTDNHLNFHEVMSHIDTNAFSETFCPKNYTDPLLINLRIHVEDSMIVGDIYNKMAETIAKVFNGSGRLITDHLYDGKTSIGAKKLLDCGGKVIIMVDGTNLVRDDGNDNIDRFEKSNLAGYTNLYNSSFSTETRRYTSSEIRTLSGNDDEKKELIQHHNNGKMSLVIPARSARNISFMDNKDTGVSMFFMCNQLDDDNMKEYHTFFSDSGASFVKKAPNLMSIDVVEKTPDQYTSKEATSRGPIHDITV